MRLSKVELKYQLKKMGIEVRGNYVRKMDIDAALEKHGERIDIIDSGTMQATDNDWKPYVNFEEFKKAVKKSMEHRSAKQWSPLPIEYHKKSNGEIHAIAFKSEKVPEGYLIAIFNIKTSKGIFSVCVW